MAQFGEMCGISVEFRKGVSFVKGHDTLKTAYGGKGIASGLIHRCEQAEDGGFGRFVAEFDVML
jgi:hypothetical protein